MVSVGCFDVVTRKVSACLTIEVAPLSELRWMIEEVHYLHRVRTGRQLNYRIRFNGSVEGAITYALPTVLNGQIAGVPVQNCIEFARLVLLHNIPHAASCAIGRSLRRIRQDWLERYPTAPLPKLVVSWSDATMHQGTIYKASNFTWLRRTCYDSRKADRNTANAKRGYHRRTDDNRHPKDCWIYHLPE